MPTINAINNKITFILLWLELLANFIRPKRFIDWCRWGQLDRSPANGSSNVLGVIQSNGCYRNSEPNTS